MRRLLTVSSLPLLLGCSAPADEPPERPMRTSLLASADTLRGGNIVATTNGPWEIRTMSRPAADPGRDSSRARGEIAFGAPAPGKTATGEESLLALDSLTAMPVGAPPTATRAPDSLARTLDEREGAPVGGASADGAKVEIDLGVDLASEELGKVALHSKIARLATTRAS